MGAAMKGNLVAPVSTFEDNQLALLRMRLRKAVEQSGWKHEAIVAEMKQRGCPGMDAPYFSKLLSGEKTTTMLHVSSLPDAVESIFHTLNAEAFGAIVVRPVSLDEARKQLATALFSLLTPERARMAKAGL